jgi:hypothetical protein
MYDAKWDERSDIDPGNIVQHSPAFATPCPLLNEEAEKKEEHSDKEGDMQPFPSPFIVENPQPQIGENRSYRTILFT